MTLLIMEENVPIGNQVLKVAELQSICGWIVDLVMTPFQKLNQMRVEAVYAVPTRSLPPRVPVGSMPGHPKAAGTGCVCMLHFHSTR
jgi:hypothetical protein